MRNFPEFLGVDVEILVDGPVAKFYEPTPVNLRVACPNLH